MESSVLILAGGRSRRFGGDKLGADWHGRSLLDHVVERMREWSDDVIVLVAHDHDAQGRSPTPGVRLLPDPEPSPGPLVGVASGLAAARHEIVGVIGGDMPLVPLRVLDLLAREAASADRSVAGLMVDGRMEPLPVCIRRPLAAARLNELVAAGARRLGALRDLNGSHGLAETRWRLLDPAGDSLRDVDTVTDLAALLSEPHHG